MISAVSSGTHIRKLLLSGGGWEDFVPEETAEIIKSVDGVSRIIDISKNDE